MRNESKGIQEQRTKSQGDTFFEIMNIDEVSDWRWITWNRREFHKLSRLLWKFRHRDCCHEQHFLVNKRIQLTTVKPQKLLSTTNNNKLEDTAALGCQWPLPLVRFQNCQCCCNSLGRYVEKRICRAFDRLLISNLSESYPLEPWCILNSDSFCIWKWNLI